MRVARVVRGDLRREIRTIGKISRIDPTARRNLSPPIAGTLLFISDKKEGDRVTSGELLFTIGSDELFALEAEYQAAMTDGRRGEALSLVSRLSAPGLDAAQIAELQGGVEPRLDQRRGALGTSGSVLFDI